MGLGVKGLAVIQRLTVIELRKLDNLPHYKADKNGHITGGNCATKHIKSADGEPVIQVKTGCQLW